MAIVQKSSSSVNGASTITPSLSGVIAGNTLVLLLSAVAQADNLPTDSAGQTWTKGFYLTNAGCEVACYYLLSANAGTHTLSATAGGSTFISYSMVEIPACTAVDVVSTVGTALNTATTISTPSMTTTFANDALFAVMVADTATGSTNANITDPPVGWTSVFAQQNTAANAGGEHCYKEISSTGAQSVSWTFNADISGSQYAAAAISFKLAAAGGAALAGSGRTTATGSATLTTKSQFAGAGSTKTSASGTLTIGGSLAAAASTSTSASGTLTTRSVFAAAAITAMSGSGTLSSGAPPVVSLKCYALKNWNTGTTPASVQSGSTTFTVTPGSMLVAVWTGWDSTQIAAPGISAGTWKTPANSAQFDGANLTLACAYIDGSVGGSITITPQTIAVGNSGELGLWVYEVTNMPSNVVVRNCVGTHVSSASQSWSQASDGSPQAGDLVFTGTMYENSQAQVSAGLSDPPSGWTSQGVNQDATNFVPTQISSRIVTSAGVQTASWSNTDTHTTEHFSFMLTLSTTGGPALSGSGSTSSTGSGTLTTKSQFVGAGSTATRASGTLTVGGALSASATTRSTGSGTLSVAAAFNGAASTSAAASGTLTSRVVLAATGATRSQGSGTLTIGSSGKNVVGKTWSIAPSFDGLLYSAWPNGDKPAGYQTSPKIVGTDIRGITLVNNYNGQGSWFRVLGYGLGLDSLKGTSSGARVLLRDPLGDNAWHEVASYLKVGKAVSYDFTQLTSVWVQVGSLGGAQVSGRALDLKVTVNGVDSNVMVGRMVNQGPRDFYFVDNVVGNDATGVKNDPAHPYRYVQNASGGTYLGIWAAWKPGDTIVPRGTGTPWTDQLAACNNRWAQFPWGPAFPVTTGADPVGQAGAVGKGYYTFYGYPGEDVHAVFNNGGGIQGCDSARAQGGSGNYVQVANLRMETQAGSARDAGGVNCQAGSDHWQIGCIEFGPWIAGSSAFLNCSGIGGQTSNTEAIDCYVHDVQGLSDLQNHGYYFGGVSGGTGYNNATTNTKLRYCVAINCSGGSNFQFYWQESVNSNFMTGNAMEHCYADTCAKYNYNIGDSCTGMDVFDCIGVRAGFSAVRLHPPSGQTAAINVEACTFVDWNQAGGSTTQPYCVVQEGFASTGSIKFRHNIMRGRGGRAGAYAVGWYTNNGSTDTAISANQNVYYDPDGVTTAGWSIDAAPIVGNPNFTAEGSLNYTLATGSAALDAVTTARAITISDDFYGIARPQGVRDDVGACEGVGT